MVVTVHFTFCVLRPQVGLPAPDLVVYLRLDPRVSAARGGYGTERYEKVDFQHKVRHQQAVRQATWHLPTCPVSGI